MTAGTRWRWQNDDSLDWFYRDGCRCFSCGCWCLEGTVGYQNRDESFLSCFRALTSQASNTSPEYECNRNDLDWSVGSNWIFISFPQQDEKGERKRTSILCIVLELEYSWWNVERSFYDNHLPSRLFFVIIDKFLQCICVYLVYVSFCCELVSSS